jgi:hypothetical protein
LISASLKCSMIACRSSACQFIDLYLAANIET